jgi:hypothetical protein
MPFYLFGFLSWLERFHCYNYDTWRRFDHFKELYLRRVPKGVIRAAEETAQGLGSAIDGRALLWTLESLDEDLDFERFFAAIPGFCESRRVVDPVGTFIKPNDKKISATLVQFMELTLSSNLISESVKQTRIAVRRNGHRRGVAFRIPTDSGSCSHRTNYYFQLTSHFPQEGGVSAAIHLSISVRNAWLHS